MMEFSYSSFSLYKMVTFSYDRAEITRSFLKIECINEIYNPFQGNKENKLCRVNNDCVSLQLEYQPSQINNTKT